jgi:hypothetical protein
LTLWTFAAAACQVVAQTQGLLTTAASNLDSHGSFASRYENGGAISLDRVASGAPTGKLFCLEYKPRWLCISNVCSALDSQKAKGKCARQIVPIDGDFARRCACPAAARPAPSGALHKPANFA